MRTPAQVSGRYDFVTDVPIQGPTDEGIRAADCWWTQNVLPQPSGNGSKSGAPGPGPACSDCNGPIPRWVNRPKSWGGGPTEYGGNGGPDCRATEIRYGSRKVAGFSLDAAGDPAATLTSDQQAWVVATLTNLNTQIGQATGTSCAGWQAGNLAATIGCFQGWYNANSGGSLRTDGVLDQDTLSALQATATAHASDFTAPYPSGQAAGPPAPSGIAPGAATPASGAVPEPPPVTPAGKVVVPHEEKKKGGKCEGLEGDEKKKCEESEGLSTGAKLGIGVGIAAVLGGIVAVVASKKKKPVGAKERRR